MCSYRFYFVVVSSIAPFAAATSAALLLTLLGSGGSHRNATALWTAAAVLAALWAFMQLKSTRIRNRIAAWPALASREFVPHTCQELRQAIKEAKTTCCARGCYPEIVGHGWGYFLSRTASRGPRIYTHRMLKREGEWWNAGATLEDVASYYEAKDNKALTSAPTMNYISVGAWFAMGNHGNGGNHPETKGSSKTMLQARVMNMQTGDVRILCTYQELRQIFDDPCSRRSHCLLQVRIDERALVPNRWLKKSVIDVSNKETAQAWLADGARLRVLFMGAARSYALGLRWDDAVHPKPGEHVDPHCCSRFGTFVQADIFSIVCGCRERASRWEGWTRYADANRWVPFLFPYQMAGTALLGYTNFELIFRLGLDAKTLHALVENMIRLVHRRFGGRSEVRHGNLGGPVFLDITMRSTFKAPLAVLRELGVVRFALHPGKYQPRYSQADLNGLRLCTQGQIYYNQNDDCSV